MRSPAGKICTGLRPDQVAECKAHAQQSLQQAAKASAAFQRTQTLAHLLNYSLATLAVVVP